jgi:hypothetical protein
MATFHASQIHRKIQYPGGFIYEYRPKNPGMADAWWQDDDACKSSVHKVNTTQHIVLVQR